MSYPQYGGFAGQGGPPHMFNGRPQGHNNQGLAPRGRISFGHRGPRLGGRNTPPVARPVEPQHQFQGQTGQQNPLLQNIAPFSINPPQQPFFQPQPNGPPDFPQPPVQPISNQINGAAQNLSFGPPLPMPGMPNNFGMPPQRPPAPAPRPPAVPFGGAPPMPSHVPTFRAVPPPPGPATFSKDKRPVQKQYNAPPVMENKTDYDPESVVTIFIGNIDERVSEILMRSLIQKCGNVANWKRVHGANNKLQAFGFCDFYDAESALRAIRLLDKVRLAQKELQVKIGNKCHPLIIAYKSLMATRLGPGVGEDAVDEGTKLQDQMILRDIDMIIEDHEDELTKILPEDKLQAVKRKATDKDATIEEIEMEDEKRQLISREIQNFRETYKGSDEVLEERIKAAGRAQRKDLDDRKSPDSVISGESASAASLKRPIRKTRSPSIATSSSSDEPIALPAKRRDTRRLAEQEKLYQDLLEEWLEREKRKKRDRERDEAREKLKRAEEKKNSRRLIRVYEDYDDDKMDEQYYSGKALAQLLKDRQRELEADQKDRDREAKVLEELKQQLIREGHPAAESHVKKLELEQNVHMISQSFKDAMINLTSDPVSSVIQIEAVRKEETVNETPSINHHRENTTISFQQARPVKRLHGGGNEMFGQSDEEEQRDDQGERRKRLFRFDDESEKKRQLADQKKASVRKLIDSIPTKKEELFEYSISWDSLDKALMEGRVKPWIGKKIQEYIGEEELTLVEFIAQKVLTKAGPRGIIQDISMVLDEDAEVFVIKLWRLLIYETEMKKSGLQTDAQSH